MGRRSKRWARRRLRRWLKVQRKRRRNLFQGLAKGRTDAALHRQVAGYAVLGLRLCWRGHDFSSRYPEAAIIGLEPDPDTFARLRTNVRGLPNVTVRQEAVASRDGEAILAPSPLSWASALRPAGGPGIGVSTRSLDSLMAELGLDSIDVRKIDVEGDEHEVLQSFARMRDVAAVVGEYHPAIHGHRFEELEGVFDGFDLDVRGNRAGVRHFRAVRR